MSEGAKREREGRPVKDERRGAKGEGTAGAKNAPLGIEGMRQSGVEFRLPCVQPESAKRTAALQRS